MKKSILKIPTICVLVFYFLVLASLCGSFVLAQEKMLEGKIMGTGQGKVWVSLGSNQGITEGMFFEVRHGDEATWKIVIKKVGESSSEAEVIEILKGGGTITLGDSVTWLLPPDLIEEKEKEKIPEKEEQKTEPVANEDKKETVPATSPPVETKEIIIDDMSGKKKGETKPATPEEEQKKYKEQKKKQYCETLTKKLYDLEDKIKRASYGNKKWNSATKKWEETSSSLSQIFQGQRQEIIERLFANGCK